jgi:RsiW-degrading membrane proteinase PrsW (M82 family)
VFSYGLSTAIVRAITAVPGHACFGVFMGTWYGLAKKQELWGNYANSQVCRTMAVLLPVLIHGTYDLIATVGNTWIFVLFIAVMFAISFTTVKKLSAQDHYL